VPEVRKNVDPLRVLSAIWEEHRGSLPARVARKGQRVLAMNRLAECPDLGTWREVVERMARSRRCNGSNPKGWKATFDLLLLEETRAAVLNGRWDDPDPIGERKAELEPATRRTIRIPRLADVRPVPQEAASEGAEAVLDDDPAGGPPMVSPEEIGRLGGAGEGEERGRAVSEPPAAVEELNIVDISTLSHRSTADKSTLSVESEAAPAPEVAKVPDPPAPGPPLRTFEDPDAPPWIVDLANRIGSDEAGPGELDVYRRWCRGEDLEPPEMSP
jgi:hypothetical protein